MGLRRRDPLHSVRLEGRRPADHRDADRASRETAVATVCAQGPDVGEKSLAASGGFREHQVRGRVPVLVRDLGYGTSGLRAR